MELTNTLSLIAQGLLIIALPVVIADLLSAVLAGRTGLPVAGRALTALQRAIEAKQDLGVRAP